MIMLYVVLGGLAMIGAVTVLTWALQQALLYHPDGERTRPADVGLPGVEEREIAGPDGSGILTWWAAARPGRPTLLYFHGNGGSFAERAERIRKYTAEGYGMVMMTWRGFGGRSGWPSERANVADAMAVYRALRASGVAARDIVLYGESLGTGVAVQVAATSEVGGLVLDAPYTSIVSLAERFYPFLPVRLVMTDRYETEKYLSKVTAPVLVIHGEADEIIPVAMGQKVAAGVAGPVALKTFPGAGHSDHYLFGSYEAIMDWLDDLALKRERAGASKETRTATHVAAR